MGITYVPDQHTGKFAAFITSLDAPEIVSRFRRFFGHMGEPEFEANAVQQFVYCYLVYPSHLQKTPNVLLHEGCE